MTADADLISRLQIRGSIFSLYSSLFILTLRAGFLANATSHPSLSFLVLCLTNPLVHFHLVSFSLSNNLKKHFRSVTDNRI